MARHRNILDKKSKKMLISALIQCHFDYASTAWFFNLNKTLKNKLQIAQNKLVRFILNLHHRSRITQNELDRAGMLNVNDRARQLMLNHMYNVHKCTAPSYLCSQFESITRKYNTRGTEHNLTTASAHSIARNNFTIVGSREWNALPESTKISPSKDSFKLKVKKFLRAQAHFKEASDFLYY